mmetsp:Transcript_86866/g.230826  ORF Transcript_86866/g.230826 Transcript_86866/m.230826 type:complete len:164 (-) Transcript_86866:154-645(-)
MATDKRAAADAFSDKLNATPASGHEADGYRAADDRLKSLSLASISAIRALGAADAEKELPPEIVTVLECWCFLHGEKPASVATCAKLAADPDDLRLVGMSTLECMTEEEIVEVSQRTGGLDAEVAKTRSVPVAEVASAMIEWLQASLALRRWAKEQREKAEDK